MASLPHLLIVGDDDVAAPLCAYLAGFQLAARSAADEAAVQRQLAAGRIDLVVIDQALAGIDGLALTRRLRAAPRTPVILLGGFGGAADRIVGLEMGADDVLDRTASRRELVARIQSVLRRTAGRVPEPPVTQADVIRFGGWELQRSERVLNSPAGRPVPLSNGEYQLLSAFLQSPRQVVSRDELMARTRSREMAPVERSIDLLVSRLRQKLIARQGGPALIRTVRGSGYCFDAQPVAGVRAG